MEIALTSKFSTDKLIHFYTNFMYCAERFGCLLLIALVFNVVTKSLVLTINTERDATYSQILTLISGYCHQLYQFRQDRRQAVTKLLSCYGLVFFTVKGDTLLASCLIQESVA